VEHRNLDGEGQEKRHEQENGEGGAIRRVVENLGCGLIEGLNAESVLPGLAEVVEVQKQDGQQHQHRAEQGVEKKFDRRIKLARTAPDADQQVHGHQHGLPENKEQEEIQGHEDAQHAGLQHQEPDVVFLHPVLNGAPGGKNRNPA
jgi:hypothetical protein